MAGSPGVLLLDDGRLFTGEAFGASVMRVGEAVFNTAMCGYQEVLTDPSYAEQVVAMTAPHIGNYGVNEDDAESERVWVSGFVARHFSTRPSSWRSTGSLHELLVHHGVPGLSGIDTRALVRHLRTRGAMRCVISTADADLSDMKAALEAWPGMEGRALATEVSCSQAWVANDPAEPTARIAVVDGGAKRNIVRMLIERGAYVRVHPITDPAEAWMDGVDAVLVSNGPGDPAALPGPVAELCKVLGNKPLVGICLGHQLIALALGATTYKLKFGHRGANHPVRDERSGKVAITSQNHGFAVERDSLAAAGALVTHVNLNDGTVSGFADPARRVLAVQYHPEACPGPHDAADVLDEFVAIAGGAEVRA
jgi:carbamoyl-phosphate synthase small subunit